jgi:hypothetical protein
MKRNACSFRAAAMSGCLTEHWYTLDIVLAYDFPRS